MCVCVCVCVAVCQTHCRSMSLYNGTRTPTQRQTKILPSIRRKMQTKCLQLPPKRHHEEVEGSSLTQVDSHCTKTLQYYATLFYSPGSVNPPVEEWMSSYIRIYQQQDCTKLCASGFVRAHILTCTHNFQELFLH